MGCVMCWAEKVYDDNPVALMERTSWVLMFMQTSLGDIKVNFIPCIKSFRVFIFSS